MYILDEFPKPTRKDEVFSRLEEVASYASMTEEDKIAYEADLRWASEYEEEMRSARREAREIGLAQGLAEGIAEGIEKEKWTIARNLKNLGLDIETISKASGISINDLKEKL